MVMDGKSNKAVAFIAALAFLATVMVLPATSAQTSIPACTAGVSDSYLDVSINDKTGADTITPITGKGEFEVVTTFKWDSAGKSVSAVPLTYTVKLDQGWGLAVLDRTSATIIIEPNSQQNEKEDKVNGQIFFDKDAPAFKKAKLTVEVTSPGGTCINAPQKGVGEKVFVAGFYGKMVAYLDKTLDSAGQNAKVTLPLTIENYGNGDIEAAFQLLNEEKTKLDVITPAPVIVPTNVGSTLDNTKQVNIDLKTPYKNGYMNQPATVKLKITSVSTEKREIVGPEAEVSALIQTQGVYVPGFELTTLMAAALAALLAFVRRR